MGCLNDDGNFRHWFGNIHLSGRCNRSCYFCIGQYMMGLDAHENLDTYPLAGMNAFLASCDAHGVREINLTGTNTDPLLYRHQVELIDEIKRKVSGVNIGIRTNGVTHVEMLRHYNHASVSVPSLNGRIYNSIMGGSPPNITHLLWANMNLKVNIALVPEIMPDDIFHTLDALADYGIKTVNLRELYGQPHIGSPLTDSVSTRLGMPVYDYKGMDVTYWDVHYVEVESVNLYANGRVSLTYPITKGYADDGSVLPQSEWTHGRHFEQWVSYGKEQP